MNIRKIGPLKLLMAYVHCRTKIFPWVNRISTTILEDPYNFLLSLWWEQVLLEMRTTIHISLHMMLWSECRLYCPAKHYHWGWWWSEEIQTDNRLTEVKSGQLKLKMVRMKRMEMSPELIRSWTVAEIPTHSPTSNIEDVRESYVTPCACVNVV